MQECTVLQHFLNIVFVIVYLEKKRHKKRLWKN